VAVGNALHLFRLFFDALPGIVGFVLAAVAFAVLFVEELQAKLKNHKLARWSIAVGLSLIGVGAFVSDKMQREEEDKKQRSAIQDTAVQVATTFVGNLMGFIKSDDFTQILDHELRKPENSANPTRAINTAVEKALTQTVLSNRSTAQSVPDSAKPTSRPYSILTTDEINDRLEALVAVSQEPGNTAIAQLSLIKPPGEFRTQEQVEHWERAGGSEEMNKANQQVLQRLNLRCSEIHDRTAPLIAEMATRGYKMPPGAQPNCLSSVHPFATAEEGIQNFDQVPPYLRGLIVSLKQGTR
jgi:hypothetical protein